MARKRMIDPEFWSDEEIGKWSRSARLLYIGLWNFSDDCGRFKASLGLLKGQIFPYDDPKSLKIEKLKEEVSNKIVWYEVNGLQYGYLRNFNKHQRIDRPQPSKLPPPPEEKIAEQSPNNQGLVAPNIKEVNISKDNIKPQGKERPAVDNLLNTELQKVFKDGFNIYSLINKVKKESDSGAEIPKEVLMRVCSRYWEDKATFKEPWPWFVAVVKREWLLEEHNNFKKAPMAQSIKDILGIK